MRWHNFSEGSGIILDPSSMKWWLTLASGPGSATRLDGLHLLKPGKTSSFFSWPSPKIGAKLPTWAGRWSSANPFWRGHPRGFSGPCSNSSAGTSSTSRWTAVTRFFTGGLFFESFLLPSWTSTVLTIPSLQLRNSTQPIR